MGEDRLPDATEYEVWTGDLSTEDANYLANVLGRRLTVRRSVGTGLVEVNPNQYVGLISLPSHRQLRIKPKVPAPNLFRMLAMAYELPSPFLEGDVALDELDDLLEFVVRLFSDLVQEKIDRGLHRDYVDVEENLGVVRGRIVFASDLRANYALRHRTFCRFGDLTWDVPDNQVLRQVAVLLAGWGFSPRLTSQLGRVISMLDEVTVGRFTAAEVAQFRYHRLNMDYWELHQLCRLFIDLLSPGEDVGVMPLRAFLIDMNALFERFVEQALRRRLRAPWSLAYQSRDWLGEGERVLLKPDLVVSRRGAPELVLDCKYKKLETGQYKHHDMYQLLAYCTALKLTNGVLIYPRHLVEVDEVIRIRNADIDLTQISVDLSGEWDEVLRGFDRMVSRLGLLPDREEDAA